MADALVVAGTNAGVHAVSDGEHPMIRGRIDHIAVGDGAHLWLVVDGHSIWRADPHGTARHVADLPPPDVNCLLPGPDGPILGTSEAHLYRLTNGTPELMESFEDASGRSSWYTPWGGPPDVRSMAKGVDGNLYVNVHVGGVVRSKDGGRTWEDTMDIDIDVHQVIADAARPGHAYAAAAAGLGVTVDGGDSWLFSTDGLHASYCRAVAASSDWLFVSASTGAGGRKAALYRRRIGASDPLERCTEGLPRWFTTNLNTFCLTAADDIVVAGDADGTVYWSTDDGSTWSVAASGLPGLRCVAIAQRSG